jgi:hypothetical protein
MSTGRMDAIAVVAGWLSSVMMVRQAASMADDHIAFNSWCVAGSGGYQRQLTMIS